MAHLALAQSRTVVPALPAALTLAVLALALTHTLLRPLATEIGARSMEMELQYSALEEKYRTLRMYDFPVTDEEADMVDHMRERWEELVLKAKKRDHSLTLVKKEFTLVTQSQVSEFQKEVLELHGTCTSHRCAWTGRAVALGPRVDPRSPPARFARPDVVLFFEGAPAVS